jgi:hypothetical protein
LSGGAAISESILSDLDGFLGSSRGILTAEVRPMKTALACVCCLLVASVAFAGPKTISVTIHSVPEGALVYANDARTYMGQTPITLEYPMDGSKNCQVRQGAEVRWFSGAKAEIARFTICPAIGKQQQYTFTRPADVPGAADDAQIALQRQQVTILQNMADWQAAQAAINNMQQSMALSTAIITSQRPVSCYSYPIGRKVFTNCY